MAYITGGLVVCLVMCCLCFCIRKCSSDKVSAYDNKELTASGYMNKKRALNNTNAGLNELASLSSIDEDDR